MTTSQSRTLTIPSLGNVPVHYTDVPAAQEGEGQTFLLLHGGGGPGTVAAFSELLAFDGRSRVITPTLPGYAGTERPAGVATIRQLSEIYVALLDDLDLTKVTLVGNSMGGWIAAEMSLRDPSRLDRVILVDAVGIEVEEHPVVDFFSLSFPEIAQRSYFNPAPFLIDPTTMTQEQQDALATNRATLAVYAGAPSMVDPTLRDRLGATAVKTLVVWGDSDRIVDPEYGRAFAAAMPGSDFVLLPHTGHLPQLESPQALLDTVRRFVGA